MHSVPKMSICKKFHAQKSLHHCVSFSEQLLLRPASLHNDSAHLSRHFRDTVTPLTRHDHDVPVLVPVVGAVSAGAVADGELGHLAADLVELALVLVQLVRRLDRLLLESLGELRDGERRVAARDELLQRVVHKLILVLPDGRVASLQRVAHFTGSAGGKSDVAPVQTILVLREVGATSLQYTDLYWSCGREERRHSSTRTILVLREGGVTSLQYTD